MEPLWRPVWRFPAIRRQVTKHQRHRLKYSSCEETTPHRHTIPASGSQWITFTAVLMAHFRQSKQQTAECLTTLLGAHNQTTTASAAKLSTQQYPTIDETTTAEENGKAWRQTSGDRCHARVVRAFCRLSIGHISWSVLPRGMQSETKDIHGTCHELCEHRHRLRTSLRREGIEPTNNVSVRHAVIWWWLSFETQSIADSRFVKTMLTVIGTCRQQHRHISWDLLAMPKFYS